MAELSNKYLKITIDGPGEIYHSSRFDWTGQISQVLFNGHNFCTTETNDISLLSKRGIGMCNEFGISTPIGYTNCRLGEWFPKIGVGLLLKDTDEPYNFFKEYRVQAAKTIVTKSCEHDLIIESSIPLTRGYSYELKKSFSLDNKSLNIKYTLTNTGTESIITEEYTHNFLGFDLLPVNDKYKLIFPVNIEIEKLSAIVNPSGCTKVQDNIFSWISTPESDFFYSDLNSGKEKIKTWSLENSEARIGISETVDFEPGGCNLWGKGHVISPEIFININLNPGESMDWNRKYQFYEL